MYQTMQEDFGTLIDRIRRRSRVEIQEIAALFPEFLPEWDRFTYTHTTGERKRTPRIKELFPLYQALVISGVHFTSAERNQFVALARQAIESKRGLHTHYTPREWEALLQQLADFDQLPLLPEPVGITTSGTIHVFPRSPHLHAEHRHLVGRDEWIREMQAHLAAALPAKLIIIQAAIGAGKSSALHLLRRSLEEQGAYRLCFYTCAVPVNQTPEEHLGRFLSEAMELLGLKTPREGEVPLSLTQQADRLLAHLARLDERVVFFVDNGEVILQASGQVALCWQQFFTDLVHYAHSATLLFATREWPGWAGRDRSFLILNRMPPLSPDVGATIMRRMGFDDVEEELLRQVSARCGGNPWLIELRASTLQDLPLTEDDPASPPAEETGENTHTRLIKRLLRKPHMFGDKADLEAQGMLNEVISTHLSPYAHHLLEMLACSPLALPLVVLREQASYEEGSFEELQHASLVDLDSKVYAKSALLLPVVAEAALLRLARQERTRTVEQVLIQVYRQWLTRGIESDREKSSVVAELIVFYLKHLQLLDAAEYLLRYSWLLARFGHAEHIARMTYDIMDSEAWHAPAERECGALLLRYFLAPYLGKKHTVEERTQAYLKIYEMHLTGQVSLQVHTQLYLVSQLMEAYLATLRFDEAQVLLDQTFERLPGLEQTHSNRFASLLGKKATLLGTWSEYADEQGQTEHAHELRAQAIAIYRQCIVLWERCEIQAPPGKRSAYKYRRARHLNDLGYYLRKQGRFEEALVFIEQSLDLKRQGYVEPGSLATGYGEEAQCLLGLGRFQEALHFDRLAVEDIQREASSGNSLLQEELAVYFVERAQLYLRLGRLAEAETLIEESQDHLGDDRRSHRALAHTILAEIREWQKVSPQGQLDWRWSSSYRAIVRYDPFQWLSQAGPFTPEEQEEWALASTIDDEEEGRGRREALITRSRDREVLDSIEQHREPRLLYPCIPIDEVRQKIVELGQLAAAIGQREPNAIVRRLYLDVIDEHLAYLQMIQATHFGQMEAFVRYNEAIHGRPRAEELQQAFTYVARLIALGRQRADTVEVSDLVHALLRDIGEPVAIPDRVEPVNTAPKLATTTTTPPRKFSAQTLKRFLDATMKEYGFDGWETVIDATANVERIEQLTQRLILPDKALSLSGVRLLLKEEVEAHMFRAVAGAKSRLDLLATGTRGFMATEEGLAEYKDREWARRQGKTVEEFSVGGLFGLLSTGLAAGVLTTPMTFSHLYRFLESFLVLYRSVLLIDKDVERARAKAPGLAMQRCLRTFRGVPDLTVAGGAYLKDWLYYHGYIRVSEAIRQDERVLERLLVGVVGLEQLPDLVELGIIEPPQPPRWLAYDPDLANYIQAFE